MVVVAAHTPCRGGAMDNFSSARHNTEEGASQSAQSCQTYVSSRLAFRVTASWGAQSHNTVVSNRFAFRITASWGAQSHNAVVSSRFVFHGVSNPGTLVVATTKTLSVTLWWCVVVCFTAMRGTACTSHPPQNKNSLAVTPIYHFHFNLYFLKAPLALRWSQAPRHSVTSHAPACAPHVIFYFRCLLESLLDFRSGACRFCATEAATGAFPLFTCLPCPRGCLVVFLYTFLCPVATTTLAVLSELLLSELDSDDVEDVPPLLELVVDELSVSEPSESSDARRSGRQSSSASLVGGCVPYLSPPSSPVVVACPMPSHASLST